MKIRLKPLVSDIFISVYVLISLFQRFLVEMKTQISAAFYSHRILFYSHFMGFDTIKILQPKLVRIIYIK